MRIIENVPNAARVIDAMRDLGYDINQAVAELIDNSISAGAHIIKIDFKRIDRHFTLQIVDDGQGMTKKELINAMRFGSDGHYNIDDLGKFGMGLKTASLSQCCKFTVVSRSSESGVYGYQWDINHIKRSKKWEMKEIPPDVIKKDLRFKNLKKSSGTVVIWDDIDRLDIRLEGSERPGRIAGTITDKLIMHIRMTFHRFLDGSLGKTKTISIYFNENPLKGWDPFYRNEKNTLQLDKKDFILKELSTKKPVIIEPFILPAKEGKYGFSSLDVWNEAKGLLHWNDSQGLYIYRENRLVQYGGWFGTRAKDEHTKLIRIAISFNTKHDNSFGTTMDKTRIQLPLCLFEYIETSGDIKKIIQKGRVQYNSSNDTENDGEEDEKVINGLPAVERSKKPNQVIIDHPDSVDTPKTDQVLIDQNPDLENTTKEVTTNLPIIETTEQLPALLKENFIFQNGKIEDGKLWIVETTDNENYIIRLNENHSLYKYVYMEGNKNSDITKLFETIIYAIVYTEVLFSKNRDNPNFEEINKTMSKILDEKSVK